MPSNASRRLVHFCRKGISRLYAAALQRVWQVDFSPLFDRNFYLNSYPDVANSGLDPLAHFLLYGGRERRQPHPKFDAEFYLDANPDVASARVNPLLHYLRSGWREGRRPNPVFDPVAYSENHPELKQDANAFLDYLERCAAGEDVSPGGDLERFLPATNFTTPAVPAGTVDVIVPVYSGLRQTRSCLESIRNARCRQRYELILVNDASPEPELAVFLREVASAWDLKLLENSSNLGFAASANRGMDLHPDRDVVLLNNDAEVANDWLDRLAAAARADASTSTATPFSNNGAICSYPRFCRENTLPSGTTLEDLDAAFHRVNAGRRIDLPTAVGFCMYIRRDCLRDVGPFDENTFGLGYGEENDFCRRAAERGWRHVLAADVFVYHAGSVSFAGRAAGLRERASRLLHKRYPAYESLVRRHVQSDPAKACRFAVSAYRMKTSARPVLLSITHARGGGTAEHIRDLYERVQDAVEVLVLTPSAGGVVTLENLNPEDDFRIAIDVERDYRSLLAMLKSCGVARLHVHHVVGHTLDINRLWRDLGVPFDFTAHDYFAICPQVNLGDAQGRYCGEPDVMGCKRCLAERPAHPPATIEEWRQKHAWMVTEADRVIAPSLDTALRLRRYFPSVNTVAAYHPAAFTEERAPAAPPLSSGEPLRIVVVGAMSHHKGLANLGWCAQKALNERLPLDFTLIGYVEPQLRGKQPFRQTGKYESAELPALLEKCAPHLVWFPGQVPETFSLALSACLCAGVPLALPDLGALPERVAGRLWTWVKPWNWTADEWLQFFIRVRMENFLEGCGPVPPPSRPGARTDFYQVDYLRPLCPSAQPL